MAIWLNAILFGLGVYILAFALLSALVDTLSWLLFRRSRRVLRILKAEGRNKPTVAVQVTPNDLLGLERIPWLHIYAFSLVAGLGLYALTQQMMVLLLAAAPFALRAWLTGYRKRQLNVEVLAFLTDLRLTLPLQGSLLRALQDVANRSDTRPSMNSHRPGVLPGGQRPSTGSGQRLAGITARYLAGGFHGSGLELLARLADDTQAPHLRDLVAWTRAAEEGTLASDAPFEHALSRLQAETVTAARENMQRIPTRLTILVLPALLGPAIVVLLYPMVARLLANMGGAGWYGGF